MATKVKMAVDLTEDEADALAELCKRFDWDHAERLSNRFDGGKERDAMMDAVAALRGALAKSGFAPR